MINVLHPGLRSYRQAALNGPAVSNATAELAMFDQYDIDGIKHSSSDGQRIETQVPTINARHGSKYFGLKK
jgi:hypothetical protein